MRYEKDKLIFIVGTGRSGTTLMNGLLSSHPRIAVTPETHFLKIASQWGSVEGEPEDFSVFWKHYTETSRFIDLDIDPKRCLRRIDAGGDRSFRTIFSLLLEEFGRVNSKPRVAEKTPAHWRHVGRLLTWYPTSRVIVMRRDPRAVVASLIKCPWIDVHPPSIRQGMFFGTRSSQIAAYATIWAKAYGHVLPAWLDDKRVMLVSYESLVKDSEAMLKRICDFLEEDFLPVMLESRTANADRVPPGSAKSRDAPLREWLKEHHEKAHQPVTQDSLQKWKRELSNDEVAMIEGICGSTMRRTGYHLRSHRLRRGVGRALSGIEKTIGSAEQWGRRTLRERKSSQMTIGVEN